MSRFTLRRAGVGALLALVALLAIAPVAAQAKRSKVTGGQTTIAPSSASQQFLTANGITVTPISPASAGSGGSLVLPISGGRVDAATLRGFLFHRGGLKFSRGSASVTLRHFVITSTRRGGSLHATVAGVVCVRAHGHHARHCGVRRRELRLASLANPSKTTDGSGHTVVTATLKLSAGAAHAIDRVLHTQAATAGDELGTVSIAPTTS
jgi:hypothetical protein